jgi:hypothetical protein
MTLSTDYLIVGTGPAAMIHCLHLQEYGTEVLMVGTGMYGQLKPVKYDEIGKPVNLLPIFPVLESDFWKKMAPNENSVNQLTLEKINDREFSLSKNGNKNSYCNYLIENEKNFNIPYILSYKQFGDLIFENQLTELQKKLSRNYNSGQPKFLKAGFVNGLSLYYKYLKSHEPFPIIPEKIETIDISNRIAFTNDGSIRYNNLIFTEPLPKLYEYTRIRKSFGLIHCGAKFLIFYSRKKLPENHLWYCCNIRSNIYRTFVPQENLIVVQLSRNCWNSDPVEVGAELLTLLALEENVEHLDTKTYHACYPLDVTDIDRKNEMYEYLKNHSFYLSGRFAEWRYIDLHEIKLIESFKNEVHLKQMG